MTYNDKNYGENSVLRVRLPMKASELERIIRVHCEHHGVWDDCIVKSAETDRIRAEKAEKDAEIEKLRALVGELADAVPYPSPCVGCDVYCKYYEDCKILSRRSLVSRAREVCK